MKKSEQVEAEEMLVLEAWNKQAETGVFRKHTRLLPDAKDAIRKNVKAGWEYEDIKGAIRNYAYVLSCDKFYFEYNQWTLAIFLSRGIKDDKGLRWLWFHPDYFNEEKWYTKDVKNKLMVERERRAMLEKRNNSRPISNRAVSGLANGITKAIPEKPTIELWRQKRQLLKEVKK